MESKHLTLRRHAKRRALQRFEIDLTTADLNEIGEMIRVGFATFIRKQSFRVQHYLIPWEGDVLGVVYDRNRGTPVTFLTVDQMLDETSHEVPTQIEPEIKVPKTPKKRGPLVPLKKGPKQGFFGAA